MRPSLHLSASLAWERRGMPPDELEEVSTEREVWASLLGVLPRNRATVGEDE